MNFRFKKVTTVDRSTQARRGAAVVELAVVLPLLLLVFVITVDFARVYYNAQVVTDCARVGAQYAASTDLADATGYESVVEIVEECAKDLSPPPTVTVESVVGDDEKQYVEVTVSQDFSLVMPLGFASTYNVTRTARSRLFPSALAESNEE